MLRTLFATAASALVFTAGTAFAADPVAVEKYVENKTTQSSSDSMKSESGKMAANEADKKKGNPHEGVMTEELSKEVPTMTSDEKPMEESTAPKAETYTGKVGEAVPEMTDDGKSDGTKKN